MIRIVRMTFKEEKVDEFLQLFHQKEKEIRAFKGCKKLLLWKDIDQPNVYTTYSEWNHESDLEAYRNSKFFKETWAVTKELFSTKPTAFSSQVVSNEVEE